MSGVYVTVFGSTYPKARKTHVCVLCCNPIPPGEIHRRYATLSDGNIRARREHSRCEALMAGQADRFGWDADGFAEAFREFESLKKMQQQPATSERSMPDPSTLFPLSVRVPGTRDALAVPAHCRLEAIQRNFTARQASPLTGRTGFLTEEEATWLLEHAKRS